MFSRTIPYVLTYILHRQESRDSGSINHRVRQVARKGNLPRQLVVVGLSGESCGYPIGRSLETLHPAKYGKTVKEKCSTN